MAETWRPVTGWPLYEVSSLGQVRSVRTGRLLRPTQNWSRGGRRPGYFQVTLSQGTTASRRSRYVHHLVAAEFLGPRPDGHDVDHVDWDRANNAAANLRYLPLVGNRMRWCGPGRNDFEPRKHFEREAPEDHEPMTDAELAELGAELEGAGWR